MFTVLKIEGNRMLLSWVEKSGIIKERRVINKGKAYEIQ